MYFLLQAESPAESDWDQVEEWLTDEGLVILGILIFVLLAIFVINMVVPRLVRVATSRRLANKPEEEIEQRSNTLTHVFTRSGATLLIVLGFITALPEVGLEIAPLLAGLGVAGIAIGFGAQSLVRDFLAGIFILLDNQYGKGDVVEIAGKTGVVEDIGIRRTVVRDLDGVVHWVPNGEIKVASNLTQEFSRVNMNISVSYAEDLDEVMAVINEVGRELADDADWKDVILDPPHCLRVDAFGESGIEIKIIGDVLPIRQWEVMGELRRRLKRRFDELGIEIPFPHRVMVQEAKAAGPAGPRAAVEEGHQDKEPTIRDALNRLPGESASGHSESD
ncbi:MAG TPA: mechanosensitive ion channel family protein [Dehalococcoidia bacterium]|nr:mechanosensitive ion channel family protein [Dehalococcoidia bacterium]